MSDQLYDEGMAGAVDREKEAEAEAGKLRGYSEKLAALAEMSRVAYFGPFDVGDTVSINGEMFAKVTEVSSSGVRSMTITDQVLWYPQANIASVKSMIGITPRPSSVDDRVVEDSVAGDESLPMRPPPQMPGAEMTF